MGKRWIRRVTEKKKRNWRLAEKNKIDAAKIFTPPR